MADMASLKATVHGRVQGVFFRAFVQENAERLSLTGYVRNLPGDVVEVVAEGDRQKLEKLVEYLKVGPPAAKVSRVLTDWREYIGSYSRFSVGY